MWVEVWRYDNWPRQKILVSLETATIYIKRRRIPFGREFRWSHVLAEYPNGKCVMLSSGSLRDNREVVKIIRMAIESGYSYLDLTELGQ